MYTTLVKFLALYIYILHNTPEFFQDCEVFICIKQIALYVTYQLLSLEVWVDFITFKLVLY